MKDLPKKNIFTVPEGYFEKLPENILSRRNRAKSRTLMFQSLAAAAVLVLGLVLFLFNQNSLDNRKFEANLEAEVELFINSGHWQAEDILSFTENPDIILDEIILAEWGLPDNDDLDMYEDEWWF